MTRRISNLAGRTDDATQPTVLRTRGVATTARRIELKQTQEREVARLAECQKEIDEAYDAATKNQEEYDKQLLTLSSAFLALSLAFIKDIVPPTEAISSSLLYASLIVLCICILSVLASFQISNLGQASAIACWEARKYRDDVKFPYGFATFIRGWNLFCGFLFISGICLVVSFVIVNLHQKASKPKTNHQIVSMQPTNAP